MKPGRRLIRSMAVAALLFTAVCGIAQQNDAPRLMPTEFLRSWDPITLTFDDDLGPAPGAPEDDPGELFVIEPTQAGEYRWVDRHTLQFLPADPWSPLSTVTISSGGHRYSLRTLMAPPTQVTPSTGSSNLEPVDRIVMTLPGRVDPDRLASMIEIDYRPLPGLEGQTSVRIDSNDITVRIQDPREGTERVSAVVELAEAIGYGNEIDFAIRLAEGASTAAHVARYTFSTRRLFRLTAMGSGSVSLPVSSTGSLYPVDQAISIVNQSLPLFLQFSESLGHVSLEEIRRMVSFDPSVRNFSFEVTGNRVYMHLDANSETPYSVRLNHVPVLSASGRVLAGFEESGFSFYLQRLLPYLRWDRGQAIVETFGPRVFPMEGRGVGQVDLRIYEIDPLDRSFWPPADSTLSVNEESRPPMPGDPIDTRERAIRALGTPDVSSIISLPVDESSPATDFGLDLSDYLEQISGPDSPGTYLVGYRALGSDQSRHYVTVTVTDLSLSAVEEERAVMFVVTSLSTGEPVAGASIVVETQERSGGDYLSAVQGTTDSNGRFRYEHRDRIDNTVRRIIVAHEDDVLTFDPSSPPPAFGNNHWYGSTSRWLSWLNQAPTERSESDGVRGYILTERPIYRPDEPVHLLGWIRVRQSGAIIEDTLETERRVELRGPGGRSWAYEVELDEFGQFSVDFHEEDIPTGSYMASLLDAQRGRTLDTVTFQVESYRVPRFEVQIHGVERVPIDAPFSVDLVAEYYAGGRVLGRPVFWRVTESDYYRSPVGFPGFSFSTYENIGGNFRSRSSGLTRQDTTDETGRATLGIDPTARQSASAARYLIEGTVEGADGQRVTAVKSIVALPPFSVGIRQERFVRDAQELSPEVIVLDFDSNLLPGIEYGIRVYQRQWHSYLTESDFVTGEAEYRSDVVDELIIEETHLSAAAIQELTYPIEESGVYIIEVLARDNLGRLQTVRVDTYVPGTSPVAWERTDGSVFETTADKDAYRPGDTARILLQSPFQEATALAVVEGPLGVTYDWVEITGGQAVYDVPIEPRMVPRLPVHFLLMRGRVPGTESRSTPGFDRGRPISVANSTFLNVLPTYHEIDVDLEYPATSLPGTTITMEIELTDHRGAGLDGQVALWLVDRAVLSLAQERPIEPLQAFIDPVTSRITIRDTRNEIVGNLPFREHPGGGGWDEGAESDILDRTTVRRNFQTVPYFNPAIPVANGRAEVEIDLPDNLTDFAIRAVALSGFSLFGTASGLIGVRLPVIMQTALPRFVRPGDKFSAGGVARIVEGPGGETQVQIRTQGVMLSSGSSTDTRTVNLERGLASNQYFDLEVPERIQDETVTITLGVERVADGVGDAFEVELPVREGLFHEKRAVVARSGPGVQTTFPVEDGEFREGSLRQQLVVSLDDEVIHVLGGLRFMDNVGRQTTEQWVSGIRSVLQLQTILAEMGWDREFGVNQAEWEQFLSHLETVRSGGGLYAQFPGGRGLVSLTAWILDAMRLAQDAGLETPADDYRHTARVLTEALRSDYRYLVSEYGYQERVEALAALGRAGEFDTGYAEDFLSSATSQNLYAAAVLVTAFAEQGAVSQARVSNVIDHLWGSTTFRLEAGARYFTGLAYRTGFWGGYLMTSDVRTIAAVIRALAADDPNDERLPIMVDYMLRQGDGRGWGSSANTIEVLSTLGYLLNRRDRRALPNIRFTLEFGGDRETFRTENRQMAGFSSEAQAPGTVTQNQTDSEPWLYLEAMFRPDVPPSQIEPRNDGFVVNRELQLVQNGRTVSRTPTAGRAISYNEADLIEEHITVSNPEQRYYVAVHVPLASGFEALNPELDTSGSDAVATGRLTAQPTYTRFLDESVTYYFESLGAGTYHFYFRERATFSGEFQLPPAWAEAIYDPGTWGNSAGALVLIE